MNMLFTLASEALLLPHWVSSSSFCSCGLAPSLTGVVCFIRERQVGIVVKKFRGRVRWRQARLIALDGESGLPGGYAAARAALRIFPMAIPRVIKTQVTVVPQGEIALVGSGLTEPPSPAERNPGKKSWTAIIFPGRATVSWRMAGEKGRQTGESLRRARYRINMAVVHGHYNRDGGPEHGMSGGATRGSNVSSPIWSVVVTTMDGRGHRGGRKKSLDQ